MSRLLVLLAVVLLAGSVVGQGHGETPNKEWIAYIGQEKCAPGFIPGTIVRGDAIEFGACVHDPKYWEWVVVSVDSTEYDIGDGYKQSYAETWGWVRRPDMWAMTVVERCDTVPVWQEIEIRRSAETTVDGGFTFLAPWGFDKYLIQVGEVRCVPDTTWVVKGE